MITLVGVEIVSTLFFSSSIILDSYSLLHCLVALNTEVEGTKLAASLVESAQLVDSSEKNSSSPDKGHNDPSEDTESKAPKEPSPSVPNESLDKNELSPATEIKKDAIPACAAEQKRTSHLSVSLLELSLVSIPGEASTELSKMIEHPVNAAIAQNDGFESAPSKDRLLTETEKNNGTSSKLSGDYLTKF